MNNNRDHQRRLDRAVQLHLSAMDKFIRHCDRTNTMTPVLEQLNAECDRTSLVIDEIMAEARS